jgi:AmiR/NasT family two-component response regulator
MLMTLNTRQISPADYAGRQRFPRTSTGGEHKSKSGTSSVTSVSPQNSPVVSPTVSVVRVLIAGDHTALRSCLKTMLELDPQISVVGEAADDCEMIKMAQRVRPDVVLVDLDMHCCDEFDALAEITEGKLANSVVALSIHNGEAQRTAAQRAGVNLFLEKGVPYKQLISAIRTAAIGR